MQLQVMFAQKYNKYKDKQSACKKGMTNNKYHYESISLKSTNIKS